MLDLDRVTVWRNIIKPEGLYGAQIFRWDRSDGGTTPVKTQFMNIKVSEWMPRWEKILSAGESIIGLARLLPEAAMLQSFGCVSLFVFPIFKDSTFWGYVMFDDRKRERVFTDDEAVILRSTSLMIYNVVIRHEESLQIKQMMNEIKHQTNLLHTVNQVSAILLESHNESFERDMLHSMKIIANVVQADRMYIWKNFIRDEKLYCSQIYEWSEGVDSQKDNKLAVETMYSEIVPDWEDRLSKGDCINGIVRKMSDYEKAALSPQGILSILVVPIFIKNQFWGFVGFDDCHNERIFSDKEEIILISASQIIATALIRNNMERETAEKNELVSIIVDTSPVGLAMFGENARIFNCNNAMVNMFGVSKQCYIERFLEFSPEYQPDGKKSSEKVKEMMKYTFEKKRMKTYEWVHKKLDGELIPCEVTLTHAIHNGKQIGLVYVYDLRNVRNLENNIKLLEKEVDKIYYDPLTSIYNRRYFDENLKRIIKLLSRSKGIISLLMVDIDFFKNYNDTYGHGEGDKCLKVIAETLKNSITRSEDFVARYGGEEFVIVLPNTDENGARLLAEKILKNIRNCNIPHSASNVAGCVTISIGVATGIAEYISNVEDLVKSADEMLYESKRTGRNRYSCFTQ
jgi:diguanylate cyclase (GGDEF)-like protein/PAS domain S-box-containing protein